MRGFHLTGSRIAVQYLTYFLLYSAPSMQTTKLSSKGQVIIPKHIRTLHHWKPGQELVVIDTGDGVLLKPKTPFQRTNVDDAASCLHYSGRLKTIDDMEQAIERGIKERFRDRR